MNFGPYHLAWGWIDNFQRKLKPKVYFILIGIHVYILIGTPFNNHFTFYLSYYGMNYCNVIGFQIDVKSLLVTAELFLDFLF